MTLVKTVAVVVSLAVVAVLLFKLWRQNDGSSALTWNPPERSSNPIAEAADTLKPMWEEHFVSPYLNTRAGVQFVGSDVCATCHSDQNASFRHTGMGRSLASVDLEREPPDGGFDHPASGRRYEVLLREGQMWHREFRKLPGGEEVLLQEYSVKFVTGSGHHSLTYVAETDGFLVESPITWYTSRKAWGMSPGYDRPNHQGFQREVGESCLTCHSGKLETLDRSMHRVRIIEEAIGCEQCHGPGELHVGKRAAAREESGGENARGIDHTIVNPAHLTRDLAEAVCQQCHLRTAATVLRPGKRASDFRPGLPLQSIRHDYALEDAERHMTVVGHVDQMHRSGCYQNSSTFTCVTCHSPHHEPAAADRSTHYRGICLSCHAAESCNADDLRRQRVKDDCIKCHMPTTETDIPHLAFTHHRVGIHESATADNQVAPSQAAPGRLIPFMTFEVSVQEQQRSLGLAYADLALHERQPNLRRTYQTAAWRQLQTAAESKPLDGESLATLATLTYELQQTGYDVLAEQAVADPRLEGLARCNALFLFAEANYAAGRYKQAISLLESLSQLRRHSLQWLLRADCEKQLGNAAGLKHALLQAVTIDPTLAEAHAELAAIYRRQGDADQARRHERLAKQ